MRVQNPIFSQSSRIQSKRTVVRVVDFWIEAALLVCLNSASAAVVIGTSASDTRSVEVVDLGMC